MAFFQRHRGKHVVVYTTKDGRQRALPRELTKHLDRESDHNIEAWVRQWEAKNGAATAPKVAVLDPQHNYWVAQYLDYLGKDRHRGPKTVKDHRTALGYVFDFFVKTKKLADPNDWIDAAPEMAAWAREKGRSEDQLQKMNSALRGFWAWLREEGHVLRSAPDLRLRPHRRVGRSTPLPRAIAANEVLSWAAARPETDRLAIAGLCAYFFALRPQEIFALRPVDFTAGSKALDTEAGATMARLVLDHGARLVVNIQRQRQQDGEIAVPKAHSKGIVACAGAAAAKALVNRLTALKLGPKDLIFGQWMNDWWFELWARQGLPGVTLKDLRRAAGLWLGGRTRFAEEPTSLMHHLRHRRIDTTMLYIRRPEDKLNEEEWTLDLDA